MGMTFHKAKWLCWTYSLLYLLSGLAWGFFTVFILVEWIEAWSSFVVMIIGCSITAILLVKGQTRLYQWASDIGRKEAIQSFFNGITMELLKNHNGGRKKIRRVNKIFKIKNVSCPYCSGDILFINSKEEQIQGDTQLYSSIPICNDCGRQPPMWWSEIHLIGHLEIEEVENGG